MTAKELIDTLTARNLKITTVESCTGGALASAITDEHGASGVLEKAYITYSNQAKVDLAASVDLKDQMEWVLQKHGVYSSAMAIEMALLGTMLAVAEFGVGITGTLSRVDPANPESPVGEVFYAVVTTGKTRWRQMTIPKGTPKPEAKRLVVEEVLKTLEGILAEA
jgi:nicotinamide-nucleotide amidase